MDTEFISENTAILQNTKHGNKQLTFWLKKILSHKSTEIKSYYEKLLTCYSSYYFLSSERLNLLKSYFSEKDSFQSATLTLLTSFKPKDNTFVELYSAKLSLSEDTSAMKSSCKTFVNDVLKTMENQYSFKTIKSIESLKVAISFGFGRIEKQGFISGRLVNTQLNKDGNLVFFPK